MQDSFRTQFSQTCHEVGAHFAKVGSLIRGVGSLAVSRWQWGSLCHWLSILSVSVAQRHSVQVPR
jgi:hypothetical protein